jgi:hypothetical protein
MRRAITVRSLVGLSLVAALAGCRAADAPHEGDPTTPLVNGFVARATAATSSR